ncbi:MAG: hypothetical protein V4506_15150 [Bacteroidota bacterium]
MSDKTKPVEKESSSKPKKASDDKRNPIALRMQALAKLPKVLLVLLMVGISLAIHHCTSMDAESQAVLYMFAMNGKISGRQDGSVAMKNGVMRGMAIPANPRTVAQQSARNAFGTLSSSWRSLTQVQQNSWLNAEGYNTTDIFGRISPLVGKELYNRLNGNLVDIGVAPLVTAPAPASVATVTADGANGDVSTQALTITLNDDVPANTSVKIFATAPLGFGINRPKKSAFRLIGLADAADLTPVDIAAQYSAKYGTFALNQKIYFEVVAVNKTTGQAGVPSRTITTIVA